MAQTVQGNLDCPKGSENLVCHRRPQNSFSNLFWDTILVDEQFTWERVLDLVVYHQSNHVGCVLVNKHWPGRISAILYLNIEAVIRFNNTVGIVSKHNGLIYAFNVQKKIIWRNKSSWRSGHGTFALLLMLSHAISNWVFKSRLRAI